jgi:hypothetical protein
MAKRQTRKSISVNAALYELIAGQAAGANQSISEWLSVLVRDELADTGLELPNQQFTREIVANRASFDEARTARHKRRAARRAKIRAAGEAQELADLNLPNGPDPLFAKPRGALPVDVKVTTGFCALCIDGPGPFVLRPLSNDDALVQVCDGCENGSPREGRNSFGGDRNAMVRR